MTASETLRKEVAALRKQLDNLDDQLQGILSGEATRDEIPLGVRISNLTDQSRKVYADYQTAAGRAVLATRLDELAADHVALETAGTAAATIRDRAKLLARQADQIAGEMPGRVIGVDSQAAQLCRASGQSDVIWATALRSAHEATAAQQS